MTDQEKIKKLEQYIVTYQAAHYRLAYSYVKNQQNALDIIQDAIVKALRSIHSLQHSEYMHTWFYRILMNTAIDFIRKNSRLVQLDDTYMEYETAIIQQQPDTKIDLLRAIDSLSVEQKTLIVLRFFEDMKLQDIANIMDQNLNTVKARLYSALRKLRVELTEDDLHE